VYRIMNLLLTLGLCCSGFSCSSDGSPTPEQSSPATLLSLELNEIYRKSHLPGFAISVVVDNELVFQQAFGQRNIANNKPYTNQTTQPIASISKTFIAAALVKAIDQEYFDLETDINQILPFAVINPKSPEYTIKVKHLVTHTSGLIDNEEIYMRTYHIVPGQDVTTPGAEAMKGHGILPGEGIALELLMRHYFLEGGNLYSLDNFSDIPPGETASYSNMSSSLAAYLIETASGQSYAEYVQANILNPLGMSSTSFDSQSLNPDNMATLYATKDVPFPAYTFDSYPDGGLYTSNEDFAKFLLEMMKGLAGDSTLLFPQESYQLLFRPQHQTAESAWTGIFWYISPPYIAHNGGDPGVSTRLIINSENDHGHIFVSNIDASTEENRERHQSLIAEIENAINQFAVAYRN